MGVKCYLKVVSICSSLMISDFEHLRPLCLSLPDTPVILILGLWSVTQSCPTLLDPMNCSPPGSSVHGVFRARIMKHVAISFSGVSSQPRDQTHVSCVSCTGRQMLYCCTTWEAPHDLCWYKTTTMHERPTSSLPEPCCCCSVAQLLSCVRLFATPWTTALQASVPFTIARSLLKLMSVESVMPSCRPLLLLPSIFGILLKN